MRIAIVQIRGTLRVKKKVKDTLKMLNLHKKNSCSIISSKNNAAVGMLKIVKDYVTWGELDKETFVELLKNRGKLPGKKLLTEEYLKEKLKTDINTFAEDFINLKKNIKDIPGLKPYFRLKPPVKGFEKGGIKKPFSLGGVLGYRKEKINDLIKRMI